MLQKCRFRAIMVRTRARLAVWHFDALLQAVGLMDNVSSSDTSSSLTTRIILIFSPVFSTTSISMMDQRTVAGLSKTGKDLTGGRTVVTSMGRRCASRKKAPSDFAAPKLTKALTPTAPFGAATINSARNTAPAPLAQSRAGVPNRTMVVSGFR